MPHFKPINPLCDGPNCFMELSASILKPQIGDPHQWGTQKFCSEGVQQMQLRTDDRENGDLGAVVLEAAVICYKKFHFI